MNSSGQHIIALACGCATACFPARAATTTVDWLVPSSPSSQLLVDDAGNPIATMSIDITDGTLPAGFPGSTRISGSYWTSTQPEFADSLLGNTSFAGLEFLVLPASGTSSVSYQVQIDGPLGNTAIVIGRLGSSGSPQVTLGNTGGTPLGFRSQHAWDQGLQPFDGTVVFDPGAGVLSTAPGNNTSSGFAFFQSPGAGHIDLTFTNSASSPIGDRIVIGIGVIPEPASALLLLCGGPLLLRRRR